MQRCADHTDCGYDNRDSELFCRACALPLLTTALAGRYVVEALLSKGGYAAVFRGIDRNLSRRIAIKVLLPSKTTPNEREQFLREARIAATLDHPNIAPILDYGKDGPCVFLVMPLYTAGSLRTRLAEANGPLPAQETINNLHQLAQALYYAHTRQRPVIHRDIKPENILLHQEDHRLVITDFGIARSLEPGARVGKTVTVRGTVGYMAPEQAGGIVDPRSDQYGCAVVLYEMLTGYHPLDPSGGAIPPPSTLNLELPMTMDHVVLRALSPRTEDRYADMLEFMQAFDFACNPPVLKVRTATNTSPEVRVTSRTRNRTGIPSSTDSSSTGKQKQNAYALRTEASTDVILEKCQEADQFLKQQYFSQALQAYEEVLRMDARSFHAWHGKGTALYYQGRYSKALEAYQNATEIEPDNAIVWRSAGLVLHSLQRYQQALVHFERALTINPQYVAAWYGKGDTQLAMQMLEEALASYEQALDYDSKSFQSWNGLGNARSSMGDFTGAVDAYAQALLVNPHSAVAWCNKAEALIRLGHNRAALDALNEATEMDRGYTRAWQLKATIYEVLGNPQAAQKARNRTRGRNMKN